MKTIFQLACLLLILILSSCKEPLAEVVPEKETGKLILKFSHHVNGSELTRDTMKYTNAAGNEYEINQLLYFISDLILYNSDGTQTLISSDNNIHYVNLDIPSTLSWNLSDNLPVGSYDSINFVFGLTQARNQNGLFVNPPEVDMMWPNILGGGFHLMQLNGKWKDTNSNIQNFAFHLGVGQLYHGNVINVDSIYGYVHNNFTANLPSSSITIEANKTKEVEIVMNIESWFNTPYNYNFNYWGGAIMQNQAAMQMIKDNGFDVFSVGEIK
ncbi:MAG: MbnP family protein [Bacteroidota bacterium]